MTIKFKCESIIPQNDSIRHLYNSSIFNMTVLNLNMILLDSNMTLYDVVD